VVCEDFLGVDHHDFALLFGLKKRATLLMDAHLNVHPLTIKDA
jgi:hypothetical protein